MARPSVAVERREQIIEATLQTIAQHGVQGTTLDRIAESVSMSRGHVRHFVGNRDRLLRDAAHDFFADTDGHPAILPMTLKTLDDAVEYLFGGDFQMSNDDNAIVLALVDFSRSSPEIADILADAYSQASRRLTALVAHEFPAADAATHARTASSILAMALGNVFLGDFDASPERTALLLESVATLIASLPK